MSEAVRYKGLRGVFAAFAQPGAVIMLFFGLASGLPFLLVGNTLSAWLKEAGVDYGAIGIASYVTFAYNFKFVWAPLVDKFRLPLFGRLGLRRGWLMFALLLLGAFARPRTASRHCRPCCGPRGPRAHRARSGR